MKILLTADLHGRGVWFDWLTACGADVILIAGDLLDGFSSSGVLPQMVAISRWAARVPCALALSSGNHDANFPGAIPPTEWNAADPLTTSMALAPRWMDTLARPDVIVDGCSEVTDWNGAKFVVSTIPFAPGFEGPQLANSLWEAGARLRREHRVPWFVLHHEPPEATAVGGTMGDPSLVWKIEEYQPDYVLSGHLHAQPYTGSFADRIGHTWCFNAGAPILSKALRAKVPNHILLDTVSRTASWFATPSTGRVTIRKTICLS